jgi:hypothetical protein
MVDRGAAWQAAPNHPEVPVRPIVSFPALAIAAFAFGCGGPTLVDCDRLAASQDACMDDGSLAACREANDECEDVAGGEVLVLESCPLQFSCSEPRGTSGLPE